MFKKWMARPKLSCRWEMRVPLYILVCRWEIHRAGGIPIAMLPEGRIQPKMLKPEDVERLMDSTRMGHQMWLKNATAPNGQDAEELEFWTFMGKFIIFLPSWFHSFRHRQTADGAPGFGLELDVLDMPAHFMERWAYDARTGLLEDRWMSG